MLFRSSTIFAHSDFLAVFICFDAGFWDCARPHITHRFLNLMETPPRETRRQSHATDENSLREPLRGNEKKTASIAAFLGEGIFTMGYSKNYIMYWGFYSYYNTMNPCKSVHKVKKSSCLFLVSSTVLYS